MNQTVQNMRASAQKRDEQEMKNRSDAMNRALLDAHKDVESLAGDLFFTRMVLVGVTLICALLATNFVGHC